MEIRDIIHGAISIEQWELPIVQSRYFQRLRNIKQLGFSEYSYPSASHNRYIHSMGAMHTASRAFESIFSKTLGINQPVAFERFRSLIRLAALLHDIGHGPLSHTSESVMPSVQKLHVPFYVKKGDRLATHEDYTLKILLDSELTVVLDRAALAFGFKAQHIAALIDGAVPIKDDFFIEKIDGAKINFRPILQQLISSEIDADRMDYLRRDSRYAGVSYGEFDFDWMIDNLTFCFLNGKCYLALKHRALYTFEDFLLSRYHMFLMVYFHHKSVIYDEMLLRYFQSKECDYQIPSDIEAYVQCDDAHLMTHLTSSKNEWAKRISEKNPYPLFLQLHSSIPLTRQGGAENQRFIQSLTKGLKAQNIEYILATNTSELSKYFSKPAEPIFVHYDNRLHRPLFIPLQQCTNLFQSYSAKRSMIRLYVPEEKVARAQKIGKKIPFYLDSSVDSMMT